MPSHSEALILKFNMLLCIRFYLGFVHQALSNPGNSLWPSDTHSDIIKLNELSLDVEFDPAFNVRDLISGLNVGWADCGIRNARQSVVFFGTAEEIMKVQLSGN